MKKNHLRFLFTITIVRFATLVLKLLGRNASHFPGWLANKLCPDFLGHLQKPKTLVYITGTNGKTTVSNLTANVLKDCQYDIINNASGSNVSEGVISALLAKSTFFGKPKVNYAILEVDERYTPHIYPYMAPDILVCTNLFRDSYRRNAHSEFIFNILNSYIPSHTKLILNGEDLLSNHLAWENERCYFGITSLEGHTTSNNIIKDVFTCPDCGSILDFEYIRYNHIGVAHCPNCDFGSPKMQYTIEHIDYENHRIDVKTPTGTYDFKLIGTNITDAYNTITAVALLSEIGVDIKKTQQSFEKLKVTESRFDSVNINGKELTMVLAKTQNPIAVSRVCDYVRHEDGDKSVLLMFDDIHDAKNSSENIAWIFDTDFEFLNHDSIKYIYIGGIRHQDYHLRLLMAGVPEEKMICFETTEELVTKVDFTLTSKYYFLYDLYVVNLAKQMFEDMKTRIAEGL